MPEISRFDGIIIAMFYNDHLPPHFHVRCGGGKALVAIEGLAIIRGEIPRAALRSVIRWAAAHMDELLDAWERARCHQPLCAIAGPA
jgi:hypothetical protein